MDIKIKIAFQHDISNIISVVDNVFKQYYASIFTAEQIEYMYESTYTVDALKEQMKNGNTFFIGEIDKIPVGFMAYYFNDDGGIFLSKLYVDVNKQQLGIGKKLYNTLEQIAIKNNCKYIELNVDRKNSAMYFFKKLGFDLHESVNIAFGKYTLCDYVLRKYLQP